MLIPEEPGPTSQGEVTEPEVKRDGSRQTLLGASILRISLLGPLGLSVTLQLISHLLVDCLSFPPVPLPLDWYLWRRSH